jgi:threonine synthase
MDVGNPSNFQRISYLYNSRPAEMLHDFSAFAFSDEETKKAIEDMYDQYKYVSEPHGAIGYLGWKYFSRSAANNPDRCAVLLQTAHPAKFPQAIPEAILPPLPPQLSSLSAKSGDSVLLSPEFTAFKSYLLST